MSEETWNKGLSDAVAGVHCDGQDADYENGWRYIQFPLSLEEFIQENFRIIPTGCIEVIDEEADPVP